MARSENKAVRFLQESYDELKKTSWPSKVELKQQTGVVILTVVAIATMIGIVDIILEKVILLFLK